MQNLGALQQTETNARETESPLQMLFFAAAIVSPWLLGMVCVAYLEQSFGPMWSGFYFAGFFLQCIASVAISLWLAVKGIPKVISRWRLDKVNAKPGVFQLGLAFLLITRKSWKYPAYGAKFLFLGYILVIAKLNIDAPNNFYWVLTSTMSWFAVFLVGVSGLLCLVVGQHVRRRLRVEDV